MKEIKNDPNQKKGKNKKRKGKAYSDRHDTKGSLQTDNRGRGKGKERENR
jgi:hypothetical protein